MDLVIRCANLPAPGQTVLAESSTEFCGGKGANQAVAAALAGGSVSMIGAVGSDAFGDRLIDNLLRHQVDCGSVWRRTESPSGLAVISVDDQGQNSIMVVPGANGLLTVDDVEAASETICNSDLLLIQLEIPQEAVLAGTRLARQAGVSIVLDPAPAPADLSPELFEVDLLCPNESEAATLIGQPVTSVDEAGVAAQELHRRGARNVAITLGESGTLLSGESLEGDQAILIPAFPVDVVDTTAAGDAFAGALAVRWSISGDLHDAVRYANAAGALATSNQGAQASMASLTEIENLFSTQR